MKLKLLLAAIFAVALPCAANAQATLLPPGENCFNGPTTGINGMVGVLGTITGGSGYTNGTYGGVSLTGGSGSSVTANVIVSGGVVTGVSVLNPGVAYVVGDVLSATSASIGGTGSGFSVPVNSISINSSLAGGSVGFYIPSTGTFKQTWQDSGETILNTNPVQLDANGCAVIYGAGIYRQILKDSLGNTVWDKITASTSPIGIFWAGQAGGTGNAITITDSSFALQDGATIQFLALAANTGPTTIQVSGGALIPIVNDTSSGPAALTGGEIGPGNTPMITYDAGSAEFHLVNPASTSGGGGGTTSNLTPPQGYLNLVGQASGDVIQTGDVSGTTTVYYSPFVGNTIPIWNGSVFKSVVFSELTATLTGSGSPLNSIQDECVFSNNGVPTLVTGPAWTTATAGAGNRGTGAGTAQISRLQGIWVNANSIVGYNGLSSYTIPANQCTYVGSLSIDGTAGQVSAFRSYGQSRKWGVWNAYNRQPIKMQAGDPSSSWNYSSATIRPSHNSTANSITTFVGLPEEPVDVQFSQFVSGGSGTGSTQIISQWTIGIGWNSTTAFSGLVGSSGFRIDGSSLDFILNSTTPARYITPPTIGLNVATSLEATTGSSGTPTESYGGTVANMILSTLYNG
jgi:hypothetical protein